MTDQEGGGVTVPGSWSNRTHDPQPAVLPPYLFVILLADDETSRALTDLLADVARPQPGRMPPVFAAPPVRGLSFFATGTEVEAWRQPLLSEPWEQVVYIAEHEMGLAEAIQGWPGIFLIGCEDRVASRFYWRIPADRLDVIEVSGPLDYAAAVAKKFSEGANRLFEPHEAQMLCQLSADLPVVVEPARWPSEMPVQPTMASGDGELVSDAPTLWEQLAATPIPSPYKEELVRELEQIDTSPPDSSTSRMLKRISFVVGLPWDRRSGGQVDVAKVAEALDVGHYGMQSVKEAILEYVAVLSRRARFGVSSVGDAPKLCLVGPPGVGKTTLVRSIADGLVRPLVSIPFGGFSDAESLRGWNRGYIGSGPGVVIRAVDRLNVKDGVIRLDEVEKCGRSERGNPSDVLLELLDPEQNHSYRDLFLDVPFDLSEIIFIATANSTDGMDPALRDRLEIVKLRGYTSDEKIAIARRFMIPALQESHVINDETVSIDESVLPYLVELTRDEPGVRSLERLLVRIMRKSVVELEKGSLRVNVSLDRVREWTTEQLPTRQLGFAVRSKRQ